MKTKKEVWPLTPWFTGKSPVHVGVYEMDASEFGKGLGVGRTFAYWDGISFSGLYTSPDQCMELKDKYGFFQGLPWRGLVENPADNPNLNKSMSLLEFVCEAQK